MTDFRIVLGAAIMIVAIASAGTAYAFGFGRLGNGFSSFGSTPGKGTTTAPSATGKLLAADGVSFILSSDGVSKICRAGGC